MQSRRMRIIAEMNGKDQTMGVGVTSSSTSTFPVTPFFTFCTRSCRLEFQYEPSTTWSSCDFGDEGGKGEEGGVSFTSVDEVDTTASPCSDKGLVGGM